MNEREFSAAQIRLLSRLYPLEDAAARSFYWRIILAQRADNGPDNLVDRQAFEGVLRFAVRTELARAKARLEGGIADERAWLKTFARACGRTEAYSTVSEMTRLGTAKFAQKAREIADKIMEDAPDGARVEIRWRIVLKEVLIYFKQLQPRRPEDRTPAKPEPRRDPNDSEIDRLYAEITRLEGERDEARLERELTRDLAEDQYQTNAATIAELRRELDETRNERDAARKELENWHTIMDAMIAPAKDIAIPILMLAK